jgi:hypothetical protein
MMTKQPKLGLAEMKALLPPMPVLANESQEQFEKLFDQVARTLNVQDPVELIYIRDFVRPSWEIALYTRHRTVAFDRKLKGWVGDKLSHVRDRDVRRARRVKLLAEYLAQRPPEVGHLVELEDKVLEADVEIADILKHTPGELAYNRALEGSINLHKDFEFLITSITKRRDQALQMLDLYRQGLGRSVKEAVEEILDAEYKVVEAQAVETQAVETQAVATQAVETQVVENQAAENQLPQIAPPLVPGEPTAEQTPVADQSVTAERAAVSASIDENNSDGSND